MDITKESVVTAVEWFHGYGGNALGLKRAIPGLRSIAVCERDAFVVANMVSKMEKGLLDSVPIWTDVTDFPTEPFGYQQLDLFIASYPCQGFSHAGKRLGADDHRHLWPYCRKFITAVRPGWVAHGEAGQSSQPNESGGTSQTQPPVGGNADGPTPGLDLSRYTGLGDTELAEIREWMVKGTNRTDELRMCGNGVVPQTAERDFRILYEEITRTTR